VDKSKLNLFNDLPHNAGSSSSNKNEEKKSEISSSINMNAPLNPLVNSNIRASTNSVKNSQPSEPNNNSEQLSQHSSTKSVKKKESKSKKGKRTSPKSGTHIHKQISLPPADNLINIAFDKIQASKKNFSNNFTSINNSLNNIKQELCTGNGNGKNKLENTKTSGNENENVKNVSKTEEKAPKNNPVDHNLTATATNTNVHANVNVTNEIEMKNETERTNNNNQSNDNFFDQKEDIFETALDNELLYSTPPFEVDDNSIAGEGYKENKNEKPSENQVKENSTLKNKISIDNNSNYICDKSSHSSPENKQSIINNKITIPNTFNSDNVLLLNRKPSNPSVKKKSRIIQDDDEEILPVNMNISEILSLNTENNQNIGTENGNGVVISTTGNKIKIPLELKDFRSPIISDGKSEKSEADGKKTLKNNSLDLVINKEVMHPQTTKEKRPNSLDVIEIEKKRITRQKEKLNNKELLSIEIKKKKCESKEKVGDDIKNKIKNEKEKLNESNINKEKKSSTPQSHQNFNSASVISGTSKEKDETNKQSSSIVKSSEELISELMVGADEIIKKKDNISYYLSYLKDSIQKLKKKLTEKSN
jgi:hypothetical protein